MNQDVFVSLDQRQLAQITGGNGIPGLGGLGNLFNKGGQSGGTQSESGGSSGFNPMSLISMFTNGGGGFQDILSKFMSPQGA